MKVTINIDCTPLEARQFFGLPDVQPMQNAMMDVVQKRMLKEIENYTPEKFMEAWSPFMNANSDMVRAMFASFLQRGGKPSSTSAEDKG